MHTKKVGMKGEDVVWLTCDTDQEIKIFHKLVAIYFAVALIHFCIFIHVGTTDLFARIAPNILILTIHVYLAYVGIDIIF